MACDQFDCEIGVHFVLKKKSKPAHIVAVLRFRYVRMWQVSE